MEPTKGGLDPVDKELNDIINQLGKIQKNIGGKKKAQVLGEDGKIDRFMETKAQMVERLQNIRDLMESVQGQDRAGNAAKDVISSQNKIREEIAELSDEWKQLDALYRAEAKKRKSKYSHDELQTRQQIIVQLQQEIQGIKDFQRAGYIKGYQTYQLATMDDSELFRAPQALEEGVGAPNAGVQRGVKQQEITDENRLALQLIRDKDNVIDDEILKIGVGIGQLGEIARAQRDEVKLQNQMLDTLEAKVDAVHEQVTNVNLRMKDTLEKTRKADKLCMDIVCVLILIGMIIVLVKITVTGG
eukprot:gene9789-20360_t